MTSHTKIMYDFKDKVVLITGAAAGIGASVVRTILEEGIKHVTILDIDEENGYSLQEDLNTKYEDDKVKFIKCDITEEQELLNAFRTVQEEQGYIDLLINNAGMLRENIYIKQIEINFTAVVNGTIKALNFMRKDEGGHGGTIINIASIASIGYFPIVPVYSGTKTAVLKFSTMIGDDLYYSRTGVRVISICFGVTDTKLITKESISSFDTFVEEPTYAALNYEIPKQTPEQAAQGLAEVYKNGTSGSVWVVTSGKPATDITEKYLQTAKTFDDIIFN